MSLGSTWGKITDTGERHPSPASLPGFWTRRWPEKNRKPRTCWETRRTSKELSWEPRRHPASLSVAASEEEVVSPRSERVKWLRANPASAGKGKQKPPVSMSGSPPGAPGRPPPPGVRPLAAAATCAAQGPRPRLCAPPKTLRTLQPTPPASQPAARHRVPWTAACGASALDFSLSRFRFPPRGLPRGCGISAPALRWAGRRCGRCVPDDHLAGPGSTPGTDWSPLPPLPLPAHPEPPTPERASATPSPTFPAGRRGPHSPLSPLDSSSGCSRRGRGGSAFVPWGWQVRLGPGRTQETTAELGIPDRGRSLPAALPAAVAAAVEIVPALCRPHLSYLIHHYRIPPNRGAPQHFAT